MADPTPAPAPTGEPPVPTKPTPTPAPAQTPEQIREEAMAAARSEFSAQLEELTGHKTVEAAKAAKAKAEADRLVADGKFKEAADAANARAEQAEVRYRTAAIKGALLGASAEAIDPQVVHDLLAHQAQVGDDGTVTVGGKPAAEAVAALLKDKPYLAKPQGGEGSGSGAGDGNGAGAKSVTRTQWNAMTPDARSAHAKAGGTVVEG